MSLPIIRKKRRKNDANANTEKTQVLWDKNSATPNKACSDAKDFTGEAYFSDTMKQLRVLQDQLRCVLCGVLPGERYSTRCCEHKYCKRCLPKVSGKICLVCDIPVPKGNTMLDKFYTGLIVVTERFKNAF